PPSARITIDSVPDPWPGAPSGFGRGGPPSGPPPSGPPGPPPLGGGPARRLAPLSWLSNCPMRNECRANSVTSPISTHTTATTASCWAISLARNDLGRLPGRLEDIPGAPHGVDHRLAAGVDLLA